MKNQSVADILYAIADLLDLKGEVFFKSRAYRIAAQTIESMDEDIAHVVEEERLESISGIGKALAQKIAEIVHTGRLQYFEQLKKEIPGGLLEMLRIPGLGPKKVSALYTALGISSMNALQKAAEEGRLRDLPGFGEITEQNILRGIQLLEKTRGRALLNVAYADAVQYCSYMQQCTEVDNIEVAGSVRRMKETIGDLDLLASSRFADRVMDFFVSYPEVAHVLAKGSTKSSVLLKDHVQVDLRVVEKKSYGAALQYFTGSKEHNVVLRNRAIRKGYKLNEYGLFDKKTGKYIAGASEKEIYKKIGFSYIEPELRENRGEFEAAQNNQLPGLVGYTDIRGDFHVHSLWSDGSDTIEALMKTACKLGYEFIGITDHSQSLKIAGGLTEDRIKRKLKEIEQLNTNNTGCKILCGTECDIKADGTLDYPDRILKLFDFVYIGIHTSFKMNAKQMTQRIIRGMENEYADFLAHPTGRLLGKRDPYELDIEAVVDAAKHTETMLEINAFPDRLDLNDVHTKLAKERKIRFVLGTDSHSTNHLSFMRFGVATARRGWLEKKDILNTYSVQEIQKKLKR